MVNRGKKRRKDNDEDDFIDDHDSDSESGASRKPLAIKASNKEEDDGLVCQLSKTRKVKVKLFKSVVLIDIREYYEDKAGNSTPSKKGISLNLDQWNVLRAHADEIDEAIAMKKQ